MAFEFSRNFQLFWPPSSGDDGVLTGFLINSAFVFETSGDTAGMMFSSPIAQTSGTIDFYAYVTADSGTDSDFNVQIRNGAHVSGDTDRPESGGSALGSQGSDINLNGTADSWQKIGALTGVTLIMGESYFALVENKSASPATDNATIATRPALDGRPYLAPSTTINRALQNADGWTSDGTQQSQSMAPMVIVFDDGTVMGYNVVEDGTSVTGTNYRGMRINPVADMVVSGIKFNDASGNYFGGSSDIGIYQAGSEFGSSAGAIPRIVAIENMPYRFAPVTLSAGTDYDIIFRPNASRTTATYSIGQGTIPADVKSCNFFQTTMVSGATPGTLTEDDESVFNIQLIIDSFVSGGGGGTDSVLGQINMKGGFQ